MNLIALLAGMCVGLVLAGILYQKLGAWRDRRRFTDAGRWVQFASHQSLYLVEQGTAGGVAVIFESGIGATHLNWLPIQNSVSAFAQTASYDRAGLGWSGPATTPRTPSNVAMELHSLLKNAGIEAPYVLVGHSFGGFVMRRFASEYPDEVAGVVLVDPMRCEEWPPVNAAKQASVDRGVRLCGLAAPIAQLGVARFAVTSLLCRSGRASRWLTQAGGDGAKHVMGRVRTEIGKIPPAIRPMVAAHWSRPDFYVGVQAHVRSVPDSVREMLAAEPIRDIPVRVLTPDSSEPLSQSSLDAIGDNIKQIIVPESAHWLHLDQPEFVIDTIRAIHAAACTTPAAAAT